MQAAVNGMFNQIHAKKVINLFCESIIVTMIKELKQLDEGAMPGNPVFIPLNPAELTYEERRQALEAVNRIKENRNGIIKRRTFANGSKKKIYLKEVKIVASPMASLEGILTTLVMDAYKGREVATFDIPGAYLHAYIPKDNF